MSIPLPSIAGQQNNRKTIADLIQAFETLEKFLKVRDKLNATISKLASAGINVDLSMLTDPAKLMRTLMSIRNVNEDIDFEKIKQEINDFLSISIEDVYNACKTIRSFAEAVRTINTTIESVSRIIGVSTFDLRALGLMLGIKQSKEEEEYYTTISEEEKDMLRKEIREKGILGWSGLNLERLKELIEDNNTSKEARVICLFMFDLYKEIGLLKRLVWATLTANLSMLVSLIIYVVSKWGELYGIFHANNRWNWRIRT